jgi:hypothetical protein
VVVFLSLGSRRVEYLACTGNPDTAWMLQQARNLLMNLDDRDRQVRFLVHDRDSKFSAAFDAVFTSDGVRIIRTPVRAPNANAHVERWVGSVRWSQGSAVASATMRVNRLLASAARTSAAWRVQSKSWVVAERHAPYLLRSGSTTGVSASTGV